MSLYMGLDVVSLFFKPESIPAQLCPPDPSEQVSSTLFGGVTSRALTMAHLGWVSRGLRLSISDMDPLGSIDSENKM